MKKQLIPILYLLAAFMVNYYTAYGQDCTVTISSTAPPTGIFCPDNNTYTLTAVPDGFTSGTVSYLWFANEIFGPMIGTSSTITITNQYTQTTSTFVVFAQGTCSGNTNFISISEITIPVYSTVEFQGTPISSNSPVCEGGTLTLTANVVSIPGLTYSWAGPNGFTLPNQSNNTLTRTNATTNMDGTYTVTVTNTDGCYKTASTTVTVNLAATANAGTAQTVCAGGTVTLSGAIGGSAISATWSAPSGTFGNAGSLTSTYTPSIAANEVVLTLTTNDPTGPCPAATSTVTITVNPLPAITLGTVAAVCAGSNNFILPISAPINNPNKYSINAGTPALSGFTPVINADLGVGASSITIPIPETASSGTYQFAITLTNTATGCISTPQTFSLTINPLPDITLGNASAVCQGSTSLTLPYSFTSASPNQYSISSPTPPLTGFAPITNAALSTSPITIPIPATAAPNTYQFALTVSNTTTTCESAPKIFSLTVNPLPAITLGTVAAVCAGSSTFALPFTNPIGGANQYSISTGSPALSGFTPVSNATLSASPISIPIPTAAAPGTYQFVVSVRNSNTGCVSATQTFWLTINPLPSISFNTPTPNTSCAAPYTGAVTASATNGSSFTYAWNTTPVNNNAALAGVNGGSYTVTVTNNNGCANTNNVSIPNNNAAPFIAATPTNPTTCGGTNGSITLSGLSSGVVYLVAYTKNGSPQSGEAYTAFSGQINIIGLSAGNYTNISATVAGCTSNLLTVTLSNPAPPTISAFSNSPVCSGNNIQLQSNPAGGSGTFTSYLWSGPNSYSSVLQNPNPFAATATNGGTYNVTVTDTNACTGSNSVSVVVNATPAAPTISGASNVCIGGPNTSLSGSPTGGTWSSSNNTLATVNASGVVTGLVAGTVTITYTITQNGCSASATKLIAVENCTNPCTNPATVTLIPTNPAVCGLQTQAFNITLGGSATSATITENGFGSVSPTSISASGVVTYTPASGDLGNPIAISVTTNDPDGTGNCVAAIATATVTFNAVPNAGTINGNNSVCLGGTPITLTSTVLGGVWSSDNNGIATVNSSSGEVAAVAIGSATITYTVTNATTGCESSTTKVISVSDCACPNPAVVSVNPTSTAVCGTTPQVFTVTLSGGAISATITTQNGAGNLSPTLLNGSGTFTYTPNAADAGNTITFTITTNDPDGAGTTCSAATTTASLQVNANPIVTDITATPNPICAGQTSTLSSSPNGGVWSSSNSGVATVNSSSGVVTGNAAGMATITYTVSNANGCTASKSASITVNALPMVNATTGNPNVCVGSTTQLTNTTPGGVWSSSNESIATVSGGLVTGIAQGQATLTYTVTNATTGCQNSSSTVVTVFALPTASISGTTTICSGGSTNINFTGTSNATVTYTINGGSNQTITLNALGTATVNTGALTANAVYNLVSVVSSGSTPCTQSLSGFAAITLVSLPTASIIASAPAVCSGSSATLIFTGTDNAIVTYNTGGGSNQTIPLDASGMATVGTGNLTANTTYNLVSVALTGGAVPCSAALSGSVTVAVNPLPTANAGTDQAICQGSSTTLTASGAGLGDSYAWSNEQSGASITVSPSATTTYTVTVTDSNGCANTDAVQVEVNSSAISIIGQALGEPFITCLNDTTYFLVFTIIGGTAPYSVNGIPIASGGNNYTSPLLYTPNYQLTIADSQGCSTTVNGVNTICGVDCTITAQLLPYPNIVCADGLQIVIQNGPPQPPTYQYSINGGNFQASPVFASLPVGVYTVSISTGCGTSVIGNYTQAIAPLTVNVQINEFPQGSGAYQGSAAVIGGHPPYTIIWNNGQSGNFAQLGNLVGTGFVSITDAGGCTRVVAFTQQGVVGIENTSPTWQNFTLYPNPANTRFALSTPNPLPQVASVYLYSPIGQLISQRQSFFTQPEVFEVTQLPAGLYIVRVVSGNQYQTFKVWCSGN